MNNSTLILTTLLLVENTLLITVYLIWLKRKCQHCSKVKCLERTFNKLCSACAKRENKEKY